MSPFVVCWTEYTPWKRGAGSSGKMTDHWEAFDRSTPAENFYQQLISDPAIYTASICRPIKSTDYEPAEL